MDLFKEVKVYYLHLEAQDHQLCFTLCQLALSLFLFCFFLLATHTLAHTELLSGVQHKVHFDLSVLLSAFCHSNNYVAAIYKNIFFFFLFPFLSQQPIEVSTEHKETFFGILC